MLKAKRILAALLASLMLIPALVACSDDAGTPADGTTAAAVTTEPAETEPVETDRSQIKDSLPDDLNFDGKNFGIYCSTQYVYDTYLIGNELKEGDIINEAVYERNLKVQERLGFTLQAKAYADTWKTAGPNIAALVMAGDSTYDIYLGIQYGMCTLVTQNVFQNAFDMKYLDFDQPWWLNDFMDEIALGKDYRFLLVSDFNTNALSYARAIFFNKDLYEKIYGDPNDLYKEVLDGKWTIDRLSTLIAGAYVDLNGDGLTDNEDQLGYITNQLLSTVDGLVYASDVKFTTRDKDGFIQLAMISDDAVKLNEQLNALFHQRAVSTTSGGKEAQIFTVGKSLFLGNATLHYANDLRAMEDDYGFLPNPKSHAEQDGYHSVVHDTALLTGISTASANTDEMVSAIVEAFSAESYRTVTPAWYESALKLKYARDDISSQMIDLIRDSITTNFIFAYNGSLNGIGQVYRSLVTNNVTTYVSSVESKLPAAEANLAELIKVFKGQ